MDNRKVTQLDKWRRPVQIQFPDGKCTFYYDAAEQRWACDPCRPPRRSRGNKGACTTYEIAYKRWCSHVRVSYTHLAFTDRRLSK